MTSTPQEAEGLGNRGREHTANTRNREDLPAFCRPIIVTSISVALQEGSRLTRRLRGRAGGRVTREPKKRLNGSHSPEHPQKPVIDGAKDPGHDEGECCGRGKFARGGEEEPKEQATPRNRKKESPKRKGKKKKKGKNKRNEEKKRGASRVELTWEICGQQDEWGLALEQACREINRS